MSHFNKYFLKNKESKLCFGDHVTIQNFFFSNMEEYYIKRNIM